MVDVIIDCCAGLDVHQGTIVAGVLGGKSNRGTRSRPGKTIRTFGTTREKLQSLVAWLKAEGVTHACMEASGVYWMPVFATLEASEAVAPIVVNASHIKNVPGRKTDVKDAEWLAHLVRLGLVRNSFVPDRPFRELRELTRYRRSLVETQASERQRLIKLLEGAGIKLAGVLSDVFGVSGRAIVRALIAGTHTPQQMAALARGTARKKYAALVKALDVRLEGHQRLMLECQLQRVENAEADIAALDVEIDRRLDPYAEYMAALLRMPGIDRVVATAVIAEIGIDVSMFPTAAHLAAWAGVCPGNHQSAGKSKPTKARKGNRHLKTALCNAAISASKKTGSYYKAKYHKLKARRGGP
ncbi:MAG: IS110 family transposase [Mesorhizobium sp.]|nr:MAG: IS110 family transposase [Mesorhizobium sp.]